jgi:hypothetical protein
MRVSLLLAPVLAAALGGCAGEERPTEPLTPAAIGYVWSGEGEERNFGTDYAFCSRQVRDDGVTSLSYRPVSTAQRNASSSRRSLVDCLESRGWKRAGAR